jgi:hypothetical protein
VEEPEAYNFYQEQYQECITFCQEVWGLEMDCGRIVPAEMPIKLKKCLDALWYRGVAPEACDLSRPCYISLRAEPWCEVPLSDGFPLFYFGEDSCPVEIR